MEISKTVSESGKNHGINLKHSKYLEIKMTTYLHQMSHTKFHITNTTGHKRSVQHQWNLEWGSLVYHFYKLIIQLDKNSVTKHQS